MQKYWVPAIERANAILAVLAAEPSRLRLIDLSNRLGINKSSMFSLLNTMESIGWVVKEKGDTYALGPSLGGLSAAYFRQFNLLQAFHQEAPESVGRVGQPVQLALLEGTNVLYLAKEDSPSPVRLVSDPGMRLPAHATALGKALLLQYDYDALLSLYPDLHLKAVTPNTITELQPLWEQLQAGKKRGYTYETEESVPGFCCVAAPVYDYADRTVAAVSFTMSVSDWNDKREAASFEILRLAGRLSQLAGQVQL